MRENRTYGSEGGEAEAFPTPIKRLHSARSASAGNIKPTAAMPNTSVRMIANVKVGVRLSDRNASERFMRPCNKCAGRSLRQTIERIPGQVADVGRCDPRDCRRLSLLVWRGAHRRFSR